MRLLKAHVTNFKSINDSTPVDIDDGVTCLVGKNESGKTAFLEALFKLNPSEGKQTQFDELQEYPRARRIEDSQSIAQTAPISAVFSLSDEDVQEIESKLGRNVLESREVTASRTYAGKLLFDFKLNERAVIGNLLSAKNLRNTPIDGCTTLDEFRAKLEQLKGPPAVVVNLRNELREFGPYQVVSSVLEELLPKFLYFDNYSTLPGVISIPYILGRKRSQLDRNEVTAQALLQLAGVEAEEFNRSDYEMRRAALEGAALKVSRQAFKYWKQNKQLRVYFDADFQRPAEGDHAPPWLQVRIENRRHGTTLNFQERSAGFVWFFSFFAYVSAYRYQKEKLIILLDEPGISLHASGQGDLLDMIDKELAAHGHQVIYTTHSPFMIRANELQRARTVEDFDEIGTVISHEVCRNSKETVFPLQACLGYTMAQTLFHGRDNLVVDGPGDMIYLRVLSDLLKQQGRVSLSERWTVVPAGGLEKVPAFIALYGNHLNVAVLLDSVVGSNQPAGAMIEHRLLDPSKLVAIGEFLQRKEADLEDLFDEDFYLMLLESSGAASLSKSALGAGSRILRRIQEIRGKPIDHFRPAAHLLSNQSTLLPQIDAATLGRFEALFRRVNPLLSE